MLLYVIILNYITVIFTVKDSCSLSDCQASWIIHPATPPDAPAAATNLPLHAGRVGGDGELPQSSSRVRGSPPGSDETWAGSTPRRLEALPVRISAQCSSCGTQTGSCLYQRIPNCVRSYSPVRTQYLGPEEKGMKAWEARPCALAGSKRRGWNS